MDFMQLIIVAILVEAIWENIKMVYQEDKLSKSMIGSLVISVLICVVANIDIFPVVGVSMSIPFIGSILTGIVVSRGANFVDDLFSKLKEVK